MPIRLENHAIAYWPTPKCACTSIKYALYHLDTGTRWKNFKRPDGTVAHIHNSWHGKFKFYPLPDEDKAWRFAVIRDPVERIISCYTNRGIHYKETSAKKLNMGVCRALGIKADPDLNEFVIKLEAYRFASAQIARHSRPQHTAIGPDLDYFDRVYPMEELHMIPAEIEAQCGQAVELDHQQNKGPKMNKDALTRKALVSIREMFLGDYILLKRYYAPPPY